MTCNQLLITVANAKMIPEWKSFQVFLPEPRRQACLLRCVMRNGCVLFRCSCRRVNIQPLCGELQSQILKCYKENTGKTLSCSGIASAYMQCVDNAKKVRLKIAFSQFLPCSHFYASQLPLIMHCQAFQLHALSVYRINRSQQVNGDQLASVGITVKAKITDRRWKR